MTEDLVLNSSCGGCGSTTELYGSNCKHLTLCLACGKTMVEKRSKCFECGVAVTKLIREYIVRSSIGSDKSFSIGRFPTGLPPFSKKRSAENKWTLQKDGLQGRQMTDALREKYKNKPWILEDETGQHQFQGHIEGAQSAAYYLLMKQGKEFVAIPAGSWYNFNKTAQYKQLTLEEAEEKMNKRKNNATGYERWMMKAATNGPAAFGETKNLEGPTSVNADSSRSGKLKNEDDDHLSDHAEEDEEEEAARRNRLGLNKKGSDDDEEEARDRDFDLDDDIEKGDDWEHEEIFTVLGHEIPGLHPSFYNLPQGQQLPFTTTPTTNPHLPSPHQHLHSAFPGIFHPSQIPSAAAVHPILQNSHSVGGTDIVGGPQPGGGVYPPQQQQQQQQQPQPQHPPLNWAGNNY